MLIKFYTSVFPSLDFSNINNQMIAHNLTFLILLISAIIFLILITRLFFKKTKTAFTIYNLIFFFIIVFPFLQQQFNLIRYLPIEENRNRIKRPEGNLFSNLIAKGSNFSKEYEKYFNDNYGFRDNFIRLKNQIDYSVFKVSDELLIGKDNWLFYKNVVENEEVFVEQLTKEQVTKIQNKILNLNSELKKRGITFALMLIPMKNTVYPELITTHTVSRPKITKFDKLISFIESHPEINLINADKILKDNKNIHQLFHQTDFHWNDVGAFLVSRETISSLNEWTNHSAPWMYPLKTQTDTNFTGGQINSLAVFFPPKENIQRISNSPKSAIPDPLTPEPFLYYFKSSISSQKPLPKTLFIGNSYLLNFLNTGIFDHFSETLIIHSNDMEKIPSAIPKDVKIVIWELIEVDLLKSSIFN